MVPSSYLKTGDVISSSWIFITGYGLTFMEGVDFFVILKVLDARSPSVLLVYFLSWVFINLGSLFFLVMVLFCE